MASKAKIGVYVCHCGINIAHTVDVKAVTFHRFSVEKNSTGWCATVVLDV